MTGDKIGERLPEPGSVSQLIEPLRRGDREAAGRLWQHFYHKLVKVAAGRMRDVLHAATGPEDIAQDAVLKMCQALGRPDSRERFPRLDSRRNLWSLLVCFAVRRACDVRKQQERRLLVGESAFGEDGIDACPGREPPPDFGTAVNEVLAFLPDDTLRTVALLRLEGYTNEQIGRQIGRAVTTVELKLKTIRALLKPKLAEWDL